MTATGSAALRQLALRVLQRHAGPGADAAAIAAAAGRAYADLARVSTPLIGQTGVDALSGRAVHLAQREYPWLVHAREPARANEPFAQVILCLERQDRAAAAEGAAGVLATLAGLLVALIGGGLTSQLLRTAWPTGFLDEHDQEAHAQ